jgi:apolipoprotein D and lipocalin family protein
MVFLCLMLAACAPTITADGGVYRNAAAPIYSNAVFDTGQLEGRWDQVAAFGAEPPSGCRPGGAEFAGKDGVMQVTYRLCLSGREVAGAGPISSTGPGRFAVGGKGSIGQDWWVLWVDEGYRTLAIGNPSGTFGFILNRGKALPEDRLIAAREVFDFNGYDTAKMGGFDAER